MIDIEAMKKVGQKMCQSEAFMGPAPEGSMSWIGGQLLDAANEIEALRAEGPEIDGLRAELAEADGQIDRLQRWKDEALVVITRWERVWERLGKPGRVGTDKSQAVLDEVEHLRSLVIQLARLMPGPRGREVVLTRAESDALKSAMDGET